jgi:hypothetical protein
MRFQKPRVRAGNYGPGPRSKDLRHRLLDVLVTNWTLPRDLEYHSSDPALPGREPMTKLRHIVSAKAVIHRKREDLPEVTSQPVGPLEDLRVVVQSGVIADLEPPTELALHGVDFASR